MDYEKKYKDALEKARQLCVYPTTKPFINDLQDLFPELKENKESENERIRGAIIDHLKDNNLTEWAAWLEKQNEQKSADKVEPFDRYEGLTDFERTLADICIGWIGEEPGWKQYIKDNADVLLRIAVEKFNSVQDVPFEQNPLNIDVESMVSSYEQRLKSQGEIVNSPLVNICLTAFRHGVENTLDELRLKVFLKQEWSEEDKKMIESAISLAHEYGRHGLWVWLNSLKQRIGG